MNEKIKQYAAPLASSTSRKTGAHWRERAESLKKVTKVIGKSTKTQLLIKKDPLKIFRSYFARENKKLKLLERKIQSEVEEALKD